MTLVKTTNPTPAPEHVAPGLAALTDPATDAGRTSRNEIMRITNINGPSAAFVKSTKRFAGCETVEDMKARLTPKETIACYTYGLRPGMTEDEKKTLGRRQIEVRTVRFGRSVIVATATPVE